VGVFLHFAQDLHQGVPMRAMAAHHRVNDRCTVLGLADARLHGRLL
jgi:hypothetical protein